MRCWITDNPVRMKGMGEQSATKRNYTRFIHDGNEPIPLEEGRQAVGRCSDHWKRTQTAEAYAQYNSELGGYIERPDVQLLYYHLLWCSDIKGRYTFHDIPQSDFHEEQTKQSRTLIEKFIVYIVVNVQWSAATVSYRESGGNGDTLETLYLDFCMGEFIDPEKVKVRSATTGLGNWVAMGNKGVRHSRPWDRGKQLMGATEWAFNLDVLRTHFKLAEEKEQAERDLAAKEKPQAKEGPMSSYMREGAMS
eukprot:5780640-Prymnesium_polylepis.1